MAIHIGPLLLSITHIRHQSFYVNWISDSNLNATNQNGNAANIYLAKYTSPRVDEANFVPIKVVTHFEPNLSAHLSLLTIFFTQTYITKNEPNRFSAKVDSLQDNTAYIVKVNDSGKVELIIAKTNGKMAAKLVRTDANTCLTNWC